MTAIDAFNPPGINESFEKFEKSQTVTERYYTPRYVINASGSEGEDLCVLFHSNKICLITLAPTHPVVAQKKKIIKFDYQISSKVDRRMNKVSGKGKHGAQVLQPDSAICLIVCDDDSVYKICSCVSGKLIEINDAIEANSELIVSRPQAEGYIAIVLPSIPNSCKAKAELLSHEDFCKARGLDI